MHQVATAREALQKLEALLQDSAGGRGSGDGAGKEGGGAASDESEGGTSAGAIGTPPSEEGKCAGSAGVGVGKREGGKVGVASDGGKKGGNAGRKRGGKAASSMSSLGVVDPKYKKYEEVVTRFYQVRIRLISFSLRLMLYASCFSLRLMLYASCFSLKYEEVVTRVYQVSPRATALCACA